MIERFVYVKLNESWSTSEGCARVLAEGRSVLPTIPQVRACKGGRPADSHASKGWDLCFRLEFDSLADADAYQVHAIHKRFLDFLGPKAAAKRAWNFEMEDFPSP